MTAISEALLDKFLKGLCTEEEAAAVEAYFQQHPEDITLLNDFEQADAETALPDDYREQMLAVIERETKVGEPGRIRVIRVWAAAAAVLMIVAGGWWLVNQTKKISDNMPMQVAEVWVGRHNADTKKLALTMPDSSEVTLSPGATIRYRKDFGKYGKREVKVEGQATFAVARDEQQPFIVYSDGISTTVLGTVFTVTAEPGAREIKVRLLAGKVMVNCDPGVSDSTRPYILAPGQEFIFSKDDRSIAIRDFRGQGNGMYAARRITRLPGKMDSLNNWYMFNNQSLADVFDQLSLLYNVNIQYSREDLLNRYFIGKLEMKDSLSKIMRDIALLNHLSVTTLEGRFVVKKRTH